MQTIQYDGSYYGFFTAIFEIYQQKIATPNIQKSSVGLGSLFSNIDIETNEANAQRVLTKLKCILSPNAVYKLYTSWLSEIPGIENTLFRYIQYALAHPESIEKNLGHEAVLCVHQTAQKVSRERHRMEAFVRFQKDQEGLFYATVQPDYNVLPLISKHFEERYADQRWLIYDTKRHFGLYYDLEQVMEVEIDFSQQWKTDPHSIYDLNEARYQDLWKQYFQSVNIASRKNTALHVRHVPKRYWKYLVEKQPNL